MADSTTEQTVLHVTRETLSEEDELIVHRVAFLPGGDECDALMAACSAISCIAGKMGITFSEVLVIMDRHQRKMEKLNSEIFKTRA